MHKKLGHQKTSASKRQLTIAAAIAIIAFFTLTGIIHLSSAEILSLTPEKIQADINQLRQEKATLSEEGIGFMRISDLLDEAQGKYNSGEYTLASKTIQDAKSLIDSAKMAKASIAETNANYAALKRYHADLDILEKLGTEVSLAQQEFENENYEGANAEISAARKKIIAAAGELYSPLENESKNIISESRKASLKTSFATQLQESTKKALSSGDVATLEEINKSVSLAKATLAALTELGLEEAILAENKVDTQRISDLRAIATEYLENSEFESAYSRLIEAKQTSHKATQLLSRISKIRQALLNMQSQEQGQAPCNSECLSGLNLQIDAAAEETTYGNYEKADSDIAIIEEKMADMETQASIEAIRRETPDARLKELIYKNRFALLICFAFFFGLAFAARKELAKKIRTSQLRHAKKELEANKRILIERQKDYYISKKISRESYEESYDSIQESIFKLNEKIAKLEKNK